MIENQSQDKIQIFRTNNRKEFFNSIHGIFLKEKGIFHQSTCFDAPQQNYVTKRKNVELQ